MKEALLYARLDDGSIQCNVCPHRCKIRPGRRGICHTRMNEADRLVALNYGLSVAVAVDPIEKKPLYHFLPGSRIYSFAASGCNFHCPFCQNWEISQLESDTTTCPGKPLSPEEHVEWALHYHLPAIAYTYTEPTVFLEYALDTMKEAKAHDLKNVWVSNGFMTPETLNLILPYLDAANIDLKAPDDGTYERVCGGSAKPVMDTIKTMIQHKVHVEITTLIVPGINDRREQIQAIAAFIAEEVGTEVPWHLSRFFPAWKMKATAPTPMATLVMARDIAVHAGLKHIHLGNI